MQNISQLIIEHRNAFRNFSEKVEFLQQLTEDASPNRAAIDAALLAVEKSRIAYNTSRDRLAELMLASRTAPRAQSTPAPSERGRVSTIAQLLWEFEGKPQGTAEDDWRRAEKILRCAVVA